MSDKNSLESLNDMSQLKTTVMEYIFQTALMQLLILRAKPITYWIFINK